MIATRDAGTRWGSERYMVVVEMVEIVGERGTKTLRTPVLSRRETIFWERTLSSGKVELEGAVRAMGKKWRSGWAESQVVASWMSWRGWDMRDLLCCGAIAPRLKTPYMA